MQTPEETVQSSSAPGSATKFLASVAIAGLLWRKSRQTSNLKPPPNSSRAFSFPCKETHRTPLDPVKNEA
jgi:hypothetical protein